MFLPELLQQISNFMKQFKHARGITHCYQLDDATLRESHRLVLSTITRAVGYYENTYCQAECLKPLIAFFAAFHHNAEATLLLSPQPRSFWHRKALLHRS